MKKDFDAWNGEKKNLDGRGDAPFCHKREVWWCTLGLNVGFEQDGSGEGFRRPVIILKNLSVQTCFVIPLTTSNKVHPLRPSVGMVGGQEAHALLSQIRVIDTKRLVSKIGYLDKSVFEEIRKAVKAIL
jgi:mRNA-degrading endonuclease toxin of MazEF toxin-antitoxin module